MARDKLSALAIKLGKQEARQAHKASRASRNLAWAHKSLDRESDNRLSISTFTIGRPHHASRGIPFDHYSVMHKAEGKEFTFRYRRDALACAEEIALTGEFHPGFPQPDLDLRQEIYQRQFLEGATILLDRCNSQAK
jgi:hypothetical protein